MEHSMTRNRTDVNRIHIHKTQQPQPQAASQVQAVSEREDLMHPNAAIRSRSMNRSHTPKRPRCHCEEECHSHPCNDYSHDTHTHTHTTSSSRSSSSSYCYSSPSRPSIKVRRRRNRPFTFTPLTHDQSIHKHHFNSRIIIALLVSLQLCTAGTVSALSLSVFSSHSHISTTTSTLTTTTTSSSSSSRLQMNSMNASMNHNNSSSRLSSGTGCTGTGTNTNQFQYYNHYNHDLLNRIISGRKSVHPKWRRKARRAATLLGIPRNCNLDTEEEQEEEEEGRDCDTDTDTDGSSSFHSMDSDSDATYPKPRFSIMTPYIETMKEWNGVVTMHYQNPTSCTAFPRNNTPSANSSISSSSSPLLYKDGNVWKVSRGGGGQGGEGGRGGSPCNSNHEDESKKNHAHQQQQQQIEFHTKPVPPASSTILRSMEACNVDTYHDTNDDDNDIATENIVNDQEYMHSQTKPFKRRKLQILKYSQHRRQQHQQQYQHQHQHQLEDDHHHEEQDEKDAWDTNAKNNNVPMEQSSSSFLLPSSNHNDNSKPNINNSIINKKKKPLSLSKLFSKINHNENPITTSTTNKRNYNSLSEEEKAYAKSQWASKYTSLSTLRQTFGRNRNKLWGDFDSNTTRRLYHTLLPRALLELYDIGLWSPNELAPLAYEARKAAKKYARERCVVPGRVMAMFFDGFRMWRDWGTWSVEGMSWEQIWNKYETQILEEMMEDCREDNDGGDFREMYDFLMSGAAMDGDSDECLIDLNESNVQEEITAQICLRILERSCGTNPLIDQLFLREEDDIDNIRVQSEDEDDKSSMSSKNTSTDNNCNTFKTKNNANAKTTSQKRRRRRKRNAERDLARIRNRLEMDIQDLLQLNPHNDAQ